MNPARVLLDEVMMVMDIGIENDATPANRVPA